MLKMDQVNFIRNLEQLKGESLREIARITGHDFKTVQKYVDRDNWNDEEKIRAQQESKLDKFKPIIEKWLTDDLKVKRKQRHTAVRVFNRLIEEFRDEFDVSYRLVAYYVSKLKREIYRPNEGFLPLEHPPGEAQVDFGEAEFIENGVKYEGHYLNMSFPQSNAGYAQLFKGENQECFLEGMKSIFKHIGYVPTKIWFDNLSAAVISIGSKGERTLTDGFQKFKFHYRFQDVFCNPASGNEKGSVEAKVGYHRRNFLVPIPEFDDIHKYNRELLAKCDADMERPHYKKDLAICKLFEEDKKAMLRLNVAPYNIERLERVRTDGYGKFKVDKRYTYSSSPELANKEIWVKITAHMVFPMDDDYKTITTHSRLYGSQKESMNWYPYLWLMSRRPTAIKYSGFYKELPEPMKEYFDNCKKEYRGCALKLILKMSGESGFEAAVKSFGDALNKGAKDLDSILAIYYRITDKTPVFEELKLSSCIPELEVYKADTSIYDCLLGKGGGLVEGNN
jgi:transposase